MKDKHKTVTFGLRLLGVLNTAESHRTDDAKTMLETYGQKVDFVDFSALEQINIS